MRTRIFIDGVMIANQDVPSGKVLTFSENGQKFEVPAGESLYLRSEPVADVEGPTAFTDLFAPSTIMGDIRSVLPWNWGR